MAFLNEIVDNRMQRQGKENSGLKIMEKANDIIANIIKNGAVKKLP